MWTELDVFRVESAAIAKLSTVDFGLGPLFPAWAHTNIQFGFDASIGYSKAFGRPPGDAPFQKSKLYRFTGYGEAEFPTQAFKDMHQVVNHMSALRHHDETTRLNFVERLITQLFVSVLFTGELDPELPWPASGRPSLLLTWSIAEQGSYAPLFSTLGPRRPRIFGRSDRPAWREIHHEAYIGKKFTKQTKKLVENPNESGFGNAAPAPEKTFYDKAKDVMTKAVKQGLASGLRSGAKRLGERTAEQTPRGIGKKIRKSIEAKLREANRKR